MPFCKKCGKKVDEREKFCSGCGFPTTFDQSTSEVWTSDTPRRKKVKKLMMYGLVIMLMGPFVLAIVGLFEMFFVIWSGFTGLYYSPWALASGISTILIGLSIYFRGYHMWLKLKKSGEKIGFPFQMPQLFQKLFDRVKGEYFTSRELPESFKDCENALDVLAAWLQIRGYSVKDENEHRLVAEKGENVTDFLNSLTLKGIVSNLSSSYERSKNIDSIKHSLIVSREKGKMNFQFSFPGGFLESLDKYFLEMIVDDIMVRGLRPDIADIDVATDKQRLTRLKGLYNYVSVSSKFILWGVVWFSIPVLFEFVASIVGWKSRIFVNNELAYETPISLQIDWKIWEYQMIFFSSLLFGLIIAGFIIEARIYQNYKQTVGRIRKASTSPFQEGFLIRNFTDSVAVYPLKWGLTRFSCLIISPLTLILSILTSTQAITRITSLAFFLVGFTLLAGFTNIYSMPESFKVIEWKPRSVYSSSMMLLSVTWFFLWYDSYILSISFFGVEWKDLFFAVLYPAILISWSAVFFLSELLENSMITRFITGEKVLNAKYPIFKSLLVILAYSVTARIALFKIPLLDVAKDPSGLGIFTISNDITYLWTNLLTNWLPLILSMLIVVLFILKRVKISVSLQELKESIIWLFKDRGLDVFLFFVGFILLSAKASAFATLPFSPFLFLFFAMLFVIVEIVILEYYKMGKTLDYISHQ